MGRDTSVGEFMDAVVNRIIDDGIAAARADYGDDPKKRHKLQGSIAGFESCRGKTGIMLKQHLERVWRVRGRSYTYDPVEHKDGWSWYWWIVHYEAEVEWVCNVLSAIVAGAGLPAIVPVTARGVMAADKVLRSFSAH